MARPAPRLQVSVQLLKHLRIKKLHSIAYCSSLLLLVLRLGRAKLSPEENTENKIYGKSKKAIDPKACDTC
eukprot:5307527-Amphidinium_carterae.1